MEPIMERIRVADRMERLPVTGYHRLICLMLFLSWYCEAIDLGGTSFIMPTILKAFQLSGAMGGNYASLAFGGMLLGALIAGSLADKVGRKKVIVASMIWWGVFGLGMAMSQNVVQLFTCRFLLGIGLGAQFPVAVTFLSESVPSKVRGKYMALYQLFLPLGIATAGLLTVIILPAFGWRGVYVAEALPALACLLVWKICPESALWLEAKGHYAEADRLADMWEEKARQHLKGAPLPDVVIREQVDMRKVGLRDLFRSQYARSIVASFLVYFFAMGSDYGLTTWLTQLLVNKGFDMVRSVGFVTIGILGGIPAFFVTSWLADRFGRRPAILFASTATCVFAFIYGLSNTMAGLIVFGICYQFGKYCLTMCGAILLPELWETALRGAGTGLASSWGRIGSIAGPIAFAWIMSFGPYAAFYLGGICALIAGVGYFIVGKETKGKIF